MRHLPRLLIATPCGDTFASLRALLAGDVQMLVAAEPAQALRLLEANAIEALVVDSRLPFRMARVIAESFLRSNPSGTAVILASLEDPDTLMRLDVRSPRLEVIFRPWNDWELRTCLLGAPLEATGTA